MVSEKRKGSKKQAVTRKKLKVENQENSLPEVDKTRKEVNKYYSKIISKDTTNKPKVIEKALKLIGNDLYSASRKHDLCRVIQACLKHGNDQQKAHILECLTEDYGKLAAGKYSFFLAKKLLKIGNKEELMEKVLPQAKAMLASPNGIKFLDLLYSDGNYKNKLMKSIYAPEIEEQTGHLEEIIKNHPEIENDLKSSLHKTVRHALNKGLIEYSIVQHVVCEYTQIIEKDQKLEILGQLWDHLASLMNSKPGVRLAIEALAASDIKQRKKIVKLAQPLINLISDDESNAYLFFIKLFEVIDDTKRINKILSSTIVQNMKEIIKSKNGVKVLLYIIPANLDLFILSQSEIDFLKDDLNTLSKKDLNQKKKEIFLNISQPIIDEITESLETMIKNPRLSNLVVAVAIILSQGLIKAPKLTSAICKFVINWDIMDDNISHRALKKIIVLENKNGNKKFAGRMLKNLKEREDYVEKLIKSRGVWVFESLATSNIKEEAQEFFRKYQDKLEKSHTGEKALFEALTQSN
ncbi:unnamed protein product [Blepharisma stoltei]|uniref:CPL domain-containing protein n=1 Tax=Blepharisma stoltei TaxID=1481888 RepID=A0AAU9IA70_9CILI|nr:unnamed protein product [Blepharisma stoltei]